MVLCFGLGAGVVAPEKKEKARDSSHNAHEGNRPSQGSKDRSRSHSPGRATAIVNRVASKEAQGGDPDAGRAKVLSLGAEATKTPWTDEERKGYLESLGITKGSGEEELDYILDTALASAPLVRPWEMNRDAKGRAYFVHVPSGRSSWRHPLEQALHDVANVSRPFLALPRDKRAHPVNKVTTSWESEVASELKRWFTAKDNEGREYYYNVETEDSMWENPATSLLAALYIKTKALDLLCQDGYVPSDAPRDQQRGVVRSATEVVQQMGQQQEERHHQQIQDQQRQQQMQQQMQQQQQQQQMQQQQMQQQQQQQQQMQEQQLQEQQQQMQEQQMQQQMQEQQMQQQMQQQPQPQPQQQPQPQPPAVQLAIQQPQQQPQLQVPAVTTFDRGCSPFDRDAAERPQQQQPPSVVQITIHQPLFDQQLVQQLMQLTSQPPYVQNANPWMQLQGQMAQLGAPQQYNPDRSQSWGSQSRGMAPPSKAGLEAWDPMMAPVAPFYQAAGPRPPGMSHAPPPLAPPPPWCTITSWGQQDTLEIESLLGSAR